jgi:cell division protein ZapB
LSLLLPVELRAVNRHREHQRVDSNGQNAFRKSTKSLDRRRHALQWQPSHFLYAMASSDTIDQIAERVDHLLLRHEELQRTNALLSQQVQALSLERDQLKSRLAAARARVDALIERLPPTAPTASPEASA